MHAPGKTLLKKCVNIMIFVIFGGFHTALFEVNLLMTDSREKTRNYKRQ